jgi:uncharacterized protein YcbK (DUF882 family)
VEERQHHRCAGERGQILPLIALLMAAAAAAVLALGVLGSQTVSLAEATTAADTAALAGASSGAAIADAVATANDAELIDFERLDGGDVRVRIERDGVRATARARAIRSARGDVVGLAPAMRAALRRAEALLGRPVPVSSGYRSPAQQRRLWQRRAANPYPVAAPGTSMHERGLAIDVPASFVSTLVAVASEAGLCRPLPRTDPVHFELCGEGFTPRAHG